MSDRKNAEAFNGRRNSVFFINWP